MKTLILLMLCINIIYGNNFIIKTGKKKYLVRGLKDSKKTKNIAKTGMDYQEPDWQNKCSLSKEGPMNQTDVPGCGARIELNCEGGCLRILKVLYSCKMKDQSIPGQLSKVKKRCENKETCSVTPSRKMFGNKECPSTPENDMVMWMTYRCDVGKDRTRLTGIKQCLDNFGKSTACPF